MTILLSLQGIDYIPSPLDKTASLAAPPRCGPGPARLPACGTAGVVVKEGQEEEMGGYGGREGSLRPTFLHSDFPYIPPFRPLRLPTLPARFAVRPPSRTVLSCGDVVLTASREDAVSPRSYGDAVTSLSMPFVSRARVGARMQGQMESCHDASGYENRVKRYREP